MTFTVYIIYSASLDKFYIGYTSDLLIRLDEHNRGISVFTSGANDWVIQYSEHFSSREEAMKREKQIKLKKSRRYLEWLIGSVR